MTLLENTFVTLLGTPLAMPTVDKADSSDKPKRTVRAGRRRPSGSSKSGEREQAQAPERQRPSSSSPPPSGGSGGGSSVGSGGSSRPPMLPGGGRPMGIAGIVIIAVLALCIFGIMSLMGGGDDNSPSPVSQQQPAAQPIQATATRRAAPTLQPTIALPTPAPITASSGAPANSSNGDTWTVMLYQDADDKILEEDIFIDLNEVERIGSSDKVKIVAQMDRYRGGFSGDGNWTSTKRFLITPDNDLDRLRSQELADLGEVNMSDGDTLVDFVTWAVTNYPADKYALIMSDHGMGWPGGWSDPDPRSSGDRSIPLASAIGDQLYLMELDDALGTIRAQTGIDRLEFIGMDACLMSHVEVYDVLADHARYAAASQETEPALGWAYTSFLQQLRDNPSMDGAGLGTAIVNTYIRDDQRIVDDQARGKFVGGGALGGPTARQVAQQLESNITLSAVDLAAMPQLTASLNELAYALQGADQKAVAKARNYAQPFTSIFGSDVPPSYIDLGHFAQLAAQVTGDSNVAAAAQQVMSALNNTVIAEKHGAKKSGATGVSIYFPNSQLFRHPAAGPESYNVVASNFAQQSLWDDFLSYHYTGRRFNRSDAAVVAPERGQTVTAPGAGIITLDPVEVSSNTTTAGQPVLMSTVVRGDNVGYIYFFTGFLDQQGRSIYIADTDFLESGDTRELNGIYYPDWGEGDFNLEFDWEPLMFAISDGTNSVQTLLRPESYGASPEDAVYTVDGIYTYVDGEQRSARLYLSDGVLTQVLGYGSEGQTGPPREILPQPGDRFTVVETWYDLDAQGRFESQAAQEGGTIVFGDAPITWKELDGAPGPYIVGFIAEDLDGNRTDSYTTVTVR